DQVRGGGFEHDVATVAAGARIVAASVAVGAVRLFAQAFGREGLVVQHENVLLEIIIVASEVGSARGKRDEPAVAAQIGRSTGVIAGTAVGGAADDLQRRRGRRTRDDGTDGIPAGVGSRATGGDDPLRPRFANGGIGGTDVEAQDHVAAGGQRRAGPTVAAKGGGDIGGAEEK